MEKYLITGAAGYIGSMLLRCPDQIQNSGFQRIVNSEYVDKTGLIRLINETIGMVNNLTCVSGPHPFGKSFAAQMLCAYYDCSCDSHSLFDDKGWHRGKGFR